MGVVCFGFIGAAKDKLDKLNSEIVERINASGCAYLTQTKLRGRTVMRIGIGNVLTTEEHLRKAWLFIREMADAIGT
jgi:aromatic-L-amino-acid/L-tryptophan decarboxylase